MQHGADPIVGAQQLLALFFGASTAAILAPHLVVVIAGMAGGVLGLMSYRRSTLSEALRYVIGMGALAWLLAGTGAELAAMTSHRLDDKRLLTPVALGIGWVGHRWPGVGRWMGRMLRTFVESSLNPKKGRDQ